MRGPARGATSRASDAPGPSPAPNAGCPSCAPSAALETSVMNIKLGTSDDSRAWHASDKQPGKTGTIAPDRQQPRSRQAWKAQVTAVRSVRTASRKFASSAARISRREAGRSASSSPCSCWNTSQTCMSRAHQELLPKQAKTSESVTLSPTLSPQCNLKSSTATRLAATQPRKAGAMLRTKW